MSTPSWGNLAKRFSPPGSILSQDHGAAEEGQGMGLPGTSWASQAGPWARRQVAQEALAAVGGVGEQAQEEVVVWASGGALLSDPLPHGQRTWPREGREWISSGGLSSDPCAGWGWVDESHCVPPAQELLVTSYTRNSISMLSIQHFPAWILISRIFLSVQ